MIQSGDHSSRCIVHRRVSSWASWSEAGTITQQATTEEEADDSPSSATSLSEDLSRPLLPQLEYETEPDDDIISIVSSTVRRINWKLWVAFVLLIMSGVSNVVLAKLQSLPMYNYPTFLNMYANGMYIIISFCYILPTAIFGLWQNSIPWAHLTSLSKKPFMIMGCLDALAASMQVLATVYLPGTLLVLLPQAAIPLSMLASRFILQEKFTRYQHLGALVVMFGILVALFPVLTRQLAPDFSCQALDETSDCQACRSATTKEDCESYHREGWNESWIVESDDTLYCQWISKEESPREDDVLKFVWSIVLVMSCIPMVLSSVYKRVALQVHLDPILVNGLVAVFQFAFGLPLVVPAAYFASPKVTPFELPENWLQATECLFAQTNSIESGCHPDQCSQAAVWVHLALLSSVVYSISMILVLKYGSASLLYLGLTLMVPLGHMAFTLRATSSTHVADFAGLATLVAGLLLYRFGNDGIAEEEMDPGAVLGNRSDNVEHDVQYVGMEHELRGSDEDRNGFLEFLREPFMLVGDI